MNFEISGTCADPEVAQVLDCQDAQKRGTSYDEAKSMFYTNTPFQFLSKVALAKDGSFNLSLIKDKQLFNWACVAANLMVRETGRANVDSTKIRTTSKIKFENLENELIDYHNQEIIDLLKYGFPIECERDTAPPVVHRNHKGAVDFPEELRSYIHKQIQERTLIGPFDHNPFGDEARFSPLNTVPKKESNKRRVIMDLSWPKVNGRSVNSRINKDRYRRKNVKCTLPSIQDLVEIVRTKGTNCKIFRRDMEGAYKQFPVCLGEIHLLGFVWDGEYYWDISLPMGLVNSALICEMVSDMVIFIFKREGYSGLNYLDDLGGAERAMLAQQAFEILGQIMFHIGLVEATDKAMPPTEIGSFLGILINTQLMRIEITPHRMAEIRDELNAWMGKSTASLRQLQSLVGKLNFCATTVRAGRLFFSRILAFMKTMDRSTPFLQCPIEQSVFRDINWWLQVMPNFNGISMIPEKKWVSAKNVMACDACLTGIGGWSQGAYFHSELPEFLVIQDLDINVIECMAIMIALKIWGHKLSGTNAIVRCDNSNAVSAINSGRSQSTLMQAVLREICYQCALNDCLIRAVWIEGVSNTIPDCLSRFHLGSTYQIQFQKATRGLKLTQVLVKEHNFLFSNPW